MCIRDRHSIAQEEIFGPVLSIITYTDEDDAVRIANGTAYGLSGGVWSATDEHAERIARRLRTGQVEINGGPFNLQAPFGGYKQSGIGRRHGRDGILKFTEAQTIAAQHVIGFGGIPGVSDEAFAKGLSLGLRALKGVGLR